MSVAYMRDNKLNRIRVDLPRPTNDGPPPLTRRDRDCDAVLLDCQQCHRVHLVAIDCPPANAETREFLYDGRKYDRVVESVT